mmetsp:Transcript_11268/g.10898  ORF Transcript_11268/g.10898 Transcript_11268/m.10898 type:complete len:97 (-) Transcript_11268:158-448(-)
MSMDMLKNHLHSTVDRINDNKNNRRMKNIGISESKVVKKSHERNPKNSVNYIDAAKKVIEKKESNRNKVMKMLQLTAPKKLNKNQLKRLLALQPQK